ncbi:RNA-binding protein 33-like [Adelges cooleyi]|uniref:RNA-binding protein 33-like n=1 Tax=Adelges cooleyi TaxID=133065 RepID=UPI0021809BC3|nr:RNA-binding protein 33-like [Adelges cooleyi]
MVESHRLLRVCLLIGLFTNAICLRNIDQSRLIADRPKSIIKPSSLWDQNNSNNWKHKQAAVPPYAVKMEPMVHYSQQDPLYLNAAAAANNASLGKLLVSSGYVGGSEPRISTDYGVPGTGYGVPFQHDYYKEPEPIIEIIIKESNESLPAPPTPPPTPVTRPPKEPVQVFYVKYKKNPNSYGDKEDDIIYEPPVPAITPSSETASESETTYATEVAPQYSYATEAPTSSTTFRTIIKPDSEVYHGTGLRVTFGKTEEKWGSTLDEAQKRDSVSEPSEQQRKFKNADQEFKRSYVQPPPPNAQHADYQRSNNFESPQISNQPQPNSNNQRPNFEHPTQQQSFKNPEPQVQTFFREEHPHSNFQGPVPIRDPTSSKQQYKPQQNNFAGIVEQKPQQLNDNLPQQFNPQRVPAFQLNPPPRNPGTFIERPVQPNQERFVQPNQERLVQPNQERFVQPNQERPFLNNPFENRPNPNHPLENRPPQEIIFDNKPFESRPISDQPFDNRPGQNRPFESQPIQNRPLEIRPTQNRPILNRPFENNANQDRPFENRGNQNIINFRPHNPPTNPPSVPPNSNNPFVPSDRRPPVQPPQFPVNFNNQPVGTKHTVDLKFPPQQHQQQQQQQPQKIQQSQFQAPQFHQPQFHQPQFQQIQFQQPQFQQPQLFQQQPFQQIQFQQQYRPEIRLPISNNPTIFQQQPQFNPEVKSAVTQFQQQPLKSQQFNSENVKATSIPQFHLTPSSGFKLETHHQSAQSGQFIENYNKHQPKQPEQNSFRTDNGPWQVMNHPQHFAKLQENKETASASTVKNAIDATHKTILKTTEKPVSYVTSQYKDRSTLASTTGPPPPKPTAAEPTKNESTKTNTKNIAALPDEVPDELREQLLSSGILSNADIQILDYDKVGDIPIESLPPEALENLYGQGSAPVPSIALPPNSTNVQMKVIKYDPATEEGKNIENKYVADRPKAQTLNPVVLNDTGYNRFLPLNVNGSQFPIPNSPLLKNKAIGSVVILSPVGYDLPEDQSRSSRNTAVKVKGVHFIVGDVVKNLVKDPSASNFQTWLEKEKNTPTNEQSVILLVTKPIGKASGKEIYMYDVTHNRVSKLSGELSATFVDVAESNSQSHDLDNLSSDEEADVVVSGSSANNDPRIVSGYSKMNNNNSASRKNGASDN